MATFEEVDKDNNGSIEKPEWDALLLDDKRRQIEDEDAHRDQTRKWACFAFGVCYSTLLLWFLQVRLGLIMLLQSSAAWLVFISYLLLVWYLYLWV